MFHPNIEQANNRVRYRERYRVSITVQRILHCRLKTISKWNCRINALAAVDANLKHDNLVSMSAHPVSRRTLLKSLGLSMPLLATSGLRAQSSAENTSTKPAKTGWFYRHSVGRVQVYVLTDGTLQFPSHPTFGGDQVTAGDVQSVLSAHYRNPETIVAQMNLCLVDDGTTRTLIDTGYGKRGPATAGRLLASLQLAGYGPQDIDCILITHAHPDHLFGLTGLDGRPVFPNARIFIHDTEKKFWTKSSAELEAMQSSGNPSAGMVQTINNIFSSVDTQLETNASGARISDSLALLDLPGHTPGHQGVMISSDDQRLLVLGDTANNEILMTAQPDWPFGFDNDPAQTARTRRDIFGKVADQRIEVIAYHWSVPGLAHIGRDGTAFRWHPSPMSV